jgi:hypothetical protein
MKPIVPDPYGPTPDDVLRLAEIGRPAIVDDEVLVHGYAASVDLGTWHIMADDAATVPVSGSSVLQAVRHHGPVQIPSADRIYPLARTAGAIRRLLDGRATGKIVVRLAPPSAHEESTRRQP